MNAICCFLFDICPGDVDWSDPEAPSLTEFAIALGVGFYSKWISREVI